MNSFPNLKNPFHFFATLGGIGKIPFAPGTFGSIFSWIVFVFLSHFINMFLFTIFLFFFSIWICEEAPKYLEKRDHKAIVLDEMVGMWIALLPVLVLASTQFERTTYAIAALIFFRIFDILKPFPVSYFDKRYKNGFGIVVDDAIAALMAILPAYITLILLS